MTEITTKDCKDFLNKELNIDIKNLKRIKKYKDKDGLFILLSSIYKIQNLFL